MKVKQEAEIKFKVGQQVFYRHNAYYRSYRYISKKNIRQCTIRKIEVVSEIINGEAQTNVIYYAYALAKSSCYDRTLRKFNEDELFENKIAAQRATNILPKEERKILDQIKKIKEDIKHNRQKIVKCKEKISVIRKEELIEELSGI